MYIYCNADGKPVDGFPRQLIIHSVTKPGGFFRPGSIAGYYFTIKTERTIKRTVNFALGPFRKMCRKMLVFTLSLNIFIVMATADPGNVVFMDCMETTNINNESAPAPAPAVSQRVEQKPATLEQIAIERQVGGSFQYFKR